MVSQSDLRIGRDLGLMCQVLALTNSLDGSSNFDLRIVIFTEESRPEESRPEEVRGC